MTSTPARGSLVEKENKKPTKAVQGKNVILKACKKHKPKKNVVNKAKRRVLQYLKTFSESDISLNQICENYDLDKWLVRDQVGSNNQLCYRCLSCGCGYILIAQDGIRYWRLIG